MSGRVHAQPRATAVGGSRETASSDAERDAEWPEYPVCPECEESTFNDGAVSHELVCDGCGLVVDTNYIDHGPEWRAYSHEEYESKARTGGPRTNLRHDRGLTTTIGWRNEDHAGNGLSERARRRAGRLRKWQKRVRTQESGERTLRQILGEVTRMGSALDVPDSTREVAAAICQRATSENAVRGWSVEGVATGALYAACRQSGTPRSLDEVTAVSRVERREVGRTYKHLARELGIDLEPPHPQQYVARICSALDLPESVLRQARVVIDRTADAGLLAGKSPTGYAGAAVYAAALLADREFEVDHRAVADAADVTPVTVRTRARDQIEAMGTATIAAGLVDGDAELAPNWRADLDVDPTAVADSPGDPPKQCH